MKKEVININGMFCKKCVKTITGALKALPGMKHVNVDLDDCTATVEYDEDTLTISVIRKAIVDAGYTLPTYS
ncbi:MAG: cation transporter [Oscillospiraceae bacterium]|jgi:copper chaperone CopZ|nr:cation transporter [Oscillospiraceae bacterium]